MKFTGIAFEKIFLKSFKKIFSAFLEIQLTHQYFLRKNSMYCQRQNWQHQHPLKRKISLQGKC